ncbi:hypothetical protein B0H66DRAFT_603428 [Apodospora peruviana]|uniref:Extracellular serine-rich protein n=1 Tax=Apodospora peruviana TaxID=516989 RepID=A0AAE0I744_9PEZI|nr:hypothetical protein B0H66DRAFT_603428 [Apodospora peruviana]
MSPLSSLLLAAGLVAQATAKIIPISVGKTNLTMTPNSIAAEKGDILEFRFWAKNHSVVQGSWKTACQPKPKEEGGFWSGFVPTEAGAPNSQVFRVTINDTQPIVFYCSQNTGTHCKKGMFGVVNAGVELTLEPYAKAANGSDSAGSPEGGPYGGVFEALQATPSTTDGGSSPSSSPTNGAPAPSGTNGAGALGVSFVGMAAVGAAALALI